MASSLMPDPTTGPTDVTGPGSGVIEWRQLRKGLWVARQDGRPLGMVERGRRFIVTDANDDVCGVYRSLDAARAALTRQSGGPATKTRTARHGAALLIAAGSAALVATLLAGWGLLLLS